MAHYIEIQDVSPGTIIYVEGDKHLVVEKNTTKTMNGKHQTFPEDTLVEKASRGDTFRTRQV